MELKDLLIFLTGTGASVLAYWFISKVPTVVLARLSKANLRAGAMVLAFVIANAALLAEIGMGYQVQPDNWRAWFEALFAVGASAAGLSQLIHGYIQLPGSARVVDANVDTAALVQKLPEPGAPTAV